METAFVPDNVIVVDLTLLVVFCANVRLTVFPEILAEHHEAEEETLNVPALL